MSAKKVKSTVLILVLVEDGLGVYTKKAIMHFS